MQRLRLWFFGWYMFARAVRMARRKKHGAGRMKWHYALKMGRSYRWLVYGQKYGHQPPV